jgi:dTMP kinase
VLGTVNLRLPVMMETNGTSNNGVLVTFEGGEGSGKSTLCSLVLSDIGSVGYKCWKGREPGGTNAGVCWRQQLLNPASKLSSQAELFLFLADRAQNFVENILPRLDDNEVVFLDRHRDSTAAYQGGARGFPMELIEFGNDFATQGRRPDITFLLDIDPQAGLARSRATEFGAADRIETESLDFHQRIRTTFLALAQSEQERFVVLDATRTVEDLRAEAVRRLLTVLNKKGIIPAKVIHDMVG